MKNEKETRIDACGPVDPSPDSVKPGSLSWVNLINHAVHVADVLKRYQQHTFVNCFLMPPLELARMGNRSEENKKHLQQAVNKGLNDYSNYFFNDPILFLT